MKETDEVASKRARGLELKEILKRALEIVNEVMTVCCCRSPSSFDERTAGTISNTTAEESYDLVFLLLWKVRDFSTYS